MNKVIICISGSKYLKKGDTYVVSLENNNSYYIRGDRWYHKMNFEDLKEYRDEKINKLLEDKS